MDYYTLAIDMVKKAQRAGASQSEVCLQFGTYFSLNVHKGQVEVLTNARPRILTLRVFCGNRMSFGTLSNFTPVIVNNFVEDIVTSARLTESDPFNGLPEPDLSSVQVQDLKLYDPSGEHISIDEKIDWLKEMEAAAYAVDEKITQVHSCYQEALNTTLVVNSETVFREFSGSVYKVSCKTIASSDGRRQTGNYSVMKRYLKELPCPTEIATKAAQQGLRQLKARKVATQKVPVIFEGKVAGKFWLWISRLLNGDFIQNKKSFLQGKLGTEIAKKNVTVIDDGTILGGIGSSPFDGEGVSTQKTVLIKQGILNSYLHNTYTARVTGAKTTGNALRMANGAVKVGYSNFYLQPGEDKPEDLIKSVKNGFYVTNMLIEGGDAASGNYSTGARGLWIENGELTYPVEEVTIAGNLSELLKQIEMIGNDLSLEWALASPTFKVAALTVSGK